MDRAHLVPVALAESHSFLGVLMLDTRFPRVVGDVGNAKSFAMPVRHSVVHGATARRVVRDGDPALLQPFIEAALQLVDDGAAAITTSCGFLVKFQSALQAALPVSVWTSSLLALPMLEWPGVVTVDASSLGAAHLAAAGAAPDTPIAGLAPGCHLQRTLLEDLGTLDLAQAEADAVAAARQLVAHHPRVQTVVLECTNLPPYASAIAKATGRPVVHLLSLVHERWSALGLPR
jgi:hypothetical protein